MRGEQLGKYQLIHRLASGGMASVYLARATGPGGFVRHVVLKTLRTKGVADPALVPMFLDEARLAASLHHRNIAQVFDVGSEDGTYFLAMEYVHGETLRAVMEAASAFDGRLPLGFGVTVVCAAAAGLHHAHERRGARGVPLGIVHRDVAPSNLIVSYDGSVKLIDFGIAKAAERATHTKTGCIKGKEGYMAPEQIRGFPVDRRTDVFALGILAYEVMTLRRAFASDSQFETLERTVRCDLVLPTQAVPGFPPELEAVIMTALEPDPDDRYPNADVM
ncbi:MAG: serine/threonine protein kinase, partial [Deltaproteobacteria bacterium]|nr:serine/threonine protein kinase [Deltaproteobacteria bacterium]